MIQQNVHWQRTYQKNAAHKKLRQNSEGAVGGGGGWSDGTETPSNWNS